MIKKPEGSLRHFYEGSLNIKNATNDLSLIKPHSLLNNLTRVEEYDYFTHPLFFFTFRYQKSYLKKTLIYNDDGTSTEITSRYHRLAQATHTLFGLSVIYTGYFCCLKLFFKKI